MKGVLKAAATSNFSPVRIFFRVTATIPTIYHAREIFRILGQYGNMVEYKFTRCADTLVYLQHGFVVYENSDIAQKVATEQFIKVPLSKLFKKPVEIKVEKSDNIIITANQRLEKK
ncbi:unnamed protein product [Rhizopus stolonifer]